MSSDVDIVNLALSHLGDTANVATINPPDGSMQAEYAARFYPQARDSLLEMHDWGFATTFGTLAGLLNTSASWGYAYALPNDILKVLGIVPAGPANALFYETAREEIEAFGRPAWFEWLNRSFVVSNGAVYANEAGAVFAYTRRITDPTKFSPLFVRCLSWLLASDLAGPVLKGSAGEAAATRCMAAFLRTKADATVSDANQQSTRRGFTPGWIAAR